MSEDTGKQRFIVRPGEAWAHAPRGRTGWTQRQALEPDAGPAGGGPDGDGVSHRIREIGIRLALGAETGQVIALAVRQGMLKAVVGVAVGTGVAWFMTDLMQGLLYGVTPQDAASFVSIPALFTPVALCPVGFPRPVRPG